MLRIFNGGHPGIWVTGRAAVATHIPEADRNAGLSDQLGTAVGGFGRGGPMVYAMILGISLFTLLFMLDILTAPQH